MTNAACVYVTLGSECFCYNFVLQLRNVQNILRDKPAILSRWFSKEAFSSNNTGDDILKIHQRGNFHGKKDGRFLGGNPHILNSSAKVLSIFTSKSIPSGLDVSAKSLKVFALILDIKNYKKQFHNWLSILHSFSRVEVSFRRGFSTSGLPPHQELGMPSLSPTMTEGNIARWLKKGDKLTPGEVLCEVETDKATVEMECMEEGYLAKIVHGDGAKDIKVGEAIAITVEDEDDIAKFKDFKSSSPESTDEAKNPEPTPPKKEVAEPVSPPKRMDSKVEKARFSQSGDRVFSSPHARKLAEDNNDTYVVCIQIPLASIKGTGPDGSIIKADIEDYLASGKKGTSAPASKAQGEQAMTTLDYTDLPVSQIRKACALALRRVPQCNSSWTNDYIRLYHNVNINVAVQTENGLFVPVVRDADKKGLSTISEEVKRLATKAKENSLRPEDYEGGTFTVSNLGGPLESNNFVPSLILHSLESSLLGQVIFAVTSSVGCQ
ncbi:hypothetical protein C5167_033989 [Papaver somniferum]|uniref:Dihydrolipoamide acetyltransferase component of pyruvate dehydrogenase complex n=1 Tax=Papaver somniferum TaxID=3469 RepID=A0A4Y7KBU0_PAPSO|nr:hypothetical protein C5167_033989 [Papaver somniferum]